MEDEIEKEGRGRYGEEGRVREKARCVCFVFTGWKRLHML